MPQFTPDWEPSEKLNEAFAIARTFHARQSRKSGGVDTPHIPYIGHLMAVSALVIDQGGTEEQAIAALLHDIIEDTDLTYDDLVGMVGTAAADIVIACTDTVDKSRENRPWRTRKEEYLEGLTAKSPDDESLLVALADKMHNASSTSLELRGLTVQQRHEYWKKFNGGEDDQKWWYRGLADAFTGKIANGSTSDRQNWADLAERFAATVAEMFPD